MNEIYVKSFYSDWKKVNLQQAKLFITNIYKNIKTTSDHNKRCELIDKNHLKGISAKELLIKEEEQNA